MIEGITLKLLIGPVRPEPAPRELIDALISVQVTQNDIGQSGFQLVFHAARSGPVLMDYLTAGFFDAPRRVVLVVGMNGQDTVLMDGVITTSELAASSDPGASTLTITGSDLSKVMDLIDFSGFPWPMPPSARVAVMVAKYAMYGLIPKVVPSVLVAQPNPLNRIPKQRGTDLAYARRLAAQVGYVFYIEPGPVAGMAFAYWGPQIKVGRVQPALSVNIDGASNVDALNISFDGMRKSVFVFYYQEENSKLPIPIPVPDIGPLNPPLGRKPPVPLSYTLLSNLAPQGDDDSTAKFDALSAAMRGMARAAERADVISASGSLDVARYGGLLAPRGLVGVRGSGPTHDGTYYVKSVTSTLQRGSFKQSFRLTRNAVESFTQEVSV
ncbi:MAG: hypothetical protein EA339_14965 [Rhodobacteraceae bacterium]|nr:MAG: hypothetical protein EA339_14965 [Paracoccaceae bacterium]